MTMGYSEPRMRLGDYYKADLASESVHRTFFTTASFSTSLSRDFRMGFSFHHFRQKAVLMHDILGLGIRGNPGDSYSDGVYDDKTTGGTGSLFWKKGMHDVVLGADFDKGRLCRTLEAGPYLRARGVPAAASSDHDLETWAVYVNDTVNIRWLSVTAGIRYDHNSISGSFISPSLGLTYLTGVSVLRASVARGFTAPHLTSTSMGGLFLDPNPSLDSEDVWSYQAGIESKPFKNIWLKATLFQHDLDNALKREMSADLSSSNDKYVNKGKIRTRGFEAKAEIYPFHNFSLGVGFAYARRTPSDDLDDPKERYACNIRLSYYDEKTLNISMLGHYVHWDQDDSYEAEYDDFIWDLSVSKKVYCSDKKTLDIFLKANNIFSGSQYTYSDNKNPQRWIEIGARFKF